MASCGAGVGGRERQSSEYCAEGRGFDATLRSLWLLYLKIHCSCNLSIGIVKTPKQAEMLRCFVDIDNGHTYGRGNERLATKRATAASLASGTARSERQKKDIQKYKASFADLYFGVLLATWFSPPRPESRRIGEILVL